MLATSIIPRNICASCRLRSFIRLQQFARSGRAPSPQWSVLYTGRRTLASTGSNRKAEAQSSQIRLDDPDTKTPHSEPTPPLPRERDSEEEGLDGQVASPEDVARAARVAYGDHLPNDVLSEEEYKVYELLYGTPLGVVEGEDIHTDGEDEQRIGAELLREGEDGELEEVLLEGGDELEAGAVGPDADALLTADIERAAHDDLPETDCEDLTEDSKAKEESAAGSFMRSHPLTVQNRFATAPGTLQLPKTTLVDPIQLLISGLAPKHLSEAAHRIFGGLGLPHSIATAATGKMLQQKPIPLEASHSRMSDMDGDVWLATLMPGVFAAVTSVLTETRKRLGSIWAEKLVRKADAGELRILDAGGGGAGILAVREVLRAEWERIHSDDNDSRTALANSDGRSGGSLISPPLGHATVLTGSDALRHRASQLLDNTTFIPRLPDYVHASDTDAAGRGKFDIIITPHTLWPIEEHYRRKQHVQNLWSLLSSDGGVMVLLEKGVQRGFEAIAGARDVLLDTRIASPDGPIEQDMPISGVPRRAQEIGMIIAPCTNHSSCPMYRTQKGQAIGRKDFCRFEQRYIRPPFLQKILGAKDKNYEDVRFSYLSVMRGRDLRHGLEASDNEEVVRQGARATELAFQGYEDPDKPALPPTAEPDDGLPSAQTSTDEGQSFSADISTGKLMGIPHSLSLPRLILPPLKRRGHVILDLCTPSGTMERWTVPRSFSKQAFRDARKASWGDLWALGAKTRVMRTAKEGFSKDDDLPKRKGGKDVSGVLVDEDGSVDDSALEGPKGGRLRQGKKVKGIRDKRDKKFTGNGRRKSVLREDMLLLGPDE